MIAARSCHDRASGSPPRGRRTSRTIPRVIAAQAIAAMGSKARTSGPTHSRGSHGNQGPATKLHRRSRAYWCSAKTSHAPHHSDSAAAR